MTPARFICKACGEVLAHFDKTDSETVLRLATGLVFHTDGNAVCPGCGHKTRINFSGLQSLKPATITL
jgi:hypothetical protein